MITHMSKTDVLTSFKQEEGTAGFVVRLLKDAVHLYKRARERYDSDFQSLSAETVGEGVLRHPGKGPAKPQRL